MAKHLGRADVRRKAQHRRYAIRLAVSTGTAVLGVYVVGFQANGAILSAGQAPAPMPENTASGYVAAATAEQAPVPNAAVPSAQADALLSYNRSLVFTGTTDRTGTLTAASAQVRRPGAGTLMAPLETLTPSSGYGLRRNPITGSAGEFHWGLDFSAPCGTRVHSADAGVVRAVGWHQWGGGNRVELDHGNGLITTYNHLEGTAVRKGQSVQAGEVIAKVGTTGASTGCHLHFETVLNGSHTDPAQWTLQPLHKSGPVVDITTTDHSAGGATTDPSAWAVPVGLNHHEHDHDGHEEGHEPRETKAKVTPSTPPTPSATPAAPSPSPVKAVAPAPTAAPAPAPTRSAAPSPAPSAAPTASRAAAPAPTPTPTPTPKVTQEPVKEPDTEPSATPVASQTVAPPAP